MASKVYLDNAASTPIRKEVKEAMISCMDLIGNPSSTHFFGRESRSIIERSRMSIAQCLNANPSEIIFFSSATEANNFILQASVLHLGVKTLISSSIEHLSILETCIFLQRYRNINFRKVELNEKGEINLEHLEKILLQEKDSPCIITLSYVNNEIGNILEIEEVAKLAKKYKAYFHLDAVQAVGHKEIDLKEVSLDFLSASAHKFHGPSGAAFIYKKEKISLLPLTRGGGQEKGLRAGTENIIGIVGMAKALEIGMNRLADDRKKIKDLKKYCIFSLEKSIPIVKFNGNSSCLKKSFHTILSVKIPLKIELLAFRLEMHGIAISTGSACSSGSTQVSYVMRELHKEEDLDNNSFLRVSFSSLNKKKEIDKLIYYLALLIEKTKM